MNQNRWKYVFLSLVSLLWLEIQAQNLVPNWSFENYIQCPEYFAEKSYVSYVKNWDSPNKGTPDYFNSCSENAGVPRNWVGYADAFDGNAYMGFIACMEQLDGRQIAYREYIRIALKDTLEAGKTYFASMQIQLALSAIGACNGMGMYFSENPMNSNASTQYPIFPQIETQKIEQSKNEWAQICGTFEAKGGECYLLIGNFLSNQEMKYKAFDENLIPTRHTSPMAYYYIDAVKVLAYHDTLKNECQSLNAEEIIAFDGALDLDKKMILDNLYFEVDKANILPESFRELDQLAYELRKNQRLKIFIFGHTDNTGSDEHNEQLSQDRAIAVRNYLLNRGVSKFRIQTKGFGSTQPIDSNDNDTGRQQNRRVEIKVEY